jgi:transcriptional regulator with XRE-family HTH domain
MDPPYNLEELGEVLRRRRESLDLTREELSRRIDMTPMYIYLVEAAKPRRSGKPSQPKRKTLKQWTEALGMSDDDASRVLQLAGFHPLESVVEQTLEDIRAAPPRPTSRRTNPWDAIGSPVPATYARPSHSAERRALRSRLNNILDRAESQPDRWSPIVDALELSLDDLERQLDSNHE